MEIDFWGKDACKVINLYKGGRTCIRNVKFLKLAPTDEDLLLFDDKIPCKEVDKKVDNEKQAEAVDDSAVVRARSGCVSKSTNLNDYVYY